MGRILLAFRVFFGTLFGSITNDQVAGLLSPPTPIDSPEPIAKAPVPARPKRNDAISLLAALQREARLIDLIQEPLSDYSDEQVGAAARDVLRDTREALARMVELQPVIDAEDGDEVETPPDFDAGCYRLTGNVSGEPPFKGSLAHHGWRAAKCDIPSWTGSEEAANVVAPVEIEIG
jgi:hypothetical protein